MHVLDHPGKTALYGRADDQPFTSLDTHKHPAPQLPNPPDPIWVYAYRNEVSMALDELANLCEPWDSRSMALRECGLAGIALKCNSCGTRHLVPYRCGARTCPTCSRRLARAISDRVSARVAVHDLLMEVQAWDGSSAPQKRSWRHIVLTSRALDAEARFHPLLLRARVLEVRRAVTRFWRLTSWGKQKRDSRTGRKRSRLDTSYVVGQEIAPGGMVHVHMLVYGEFVLQAELQNLWSQALGEESLIWVTSIKNNAGIAKAIREALKYATKGEKGTRDQVRHAAVVEVAFRDVKRVSLGGALRRVSVETRDGSEDDGKPKDLHDGPELACVGCGSIGDWMWEGVVSAKTIIANGGYGYYDVGSLTCHLLMGKNEQVWGIPVCEDDVCLESTKLPGA